MVLYYRNIEGLLKVLNSTNISDIEKEISNNENLSITDFFLTTADFSIVTENTLNIDAEIFDINLKNEGGKKGKKKKKNYTTPKHVPHVRKKVKLAVLKHYAIKGDTVESLKSNCVGSCPDGVKMAAHKDRLYCGRCGIMVRRTTAVAA